ncbi:hypothetical protein K6Y31_16800 [Motilimonas cestriensis]|uniref:Uncharacterized protein n=1 Tax=Motilimonas cestriensis TaxID=2742685 RepID=A0ABS8WEA6_9GAMM|nr:hypothetical protein [Motilimonas cestriensis]MCE2596457.1 hypothetical protein [Motilimonas cestriensis]
MDFKDQALQQSAHRYFSASCFNQTWGFLDQDKPDISAMLACAYSSLHHWLNREDVSPEKLVTSHWLLARAYEKGGFASGCQLHAELCYELCQQNEFKGLDLISAYEVLARSAALTQQLEQAVEYQSLALALLESLRAEIGEEEYGYCKTDLTSINLSLCA